MNATWRPQLTINHALTTELRGRNFVRAIQATRGRVIITMLADQWDATLEAAYAAGALLMEVDHRNRVTRIFEKGN